MVVECSKLYEHMRIHLLQVFYVTNFNHDVAYDSINTKYKADVTKYLQCKSVFMYGLITIFIHATRRKSILNKNLLIK